ncbi:hypothetical protein SAMN05444007_11545 [Cribrihabitans marinus]|uniref:4Fe-4S ferredoxin-type domain-containing protein n=1 Tax=Cribrihabitans marinus TaxID=1227549 RepID=A0A1H7DYD1_9RHOB|nr:ferredoxin [Cribrihabitans marinus]GGH40634.1 hypothetical protein GCM10010973_37110 [Cribrihabitans marinus]SEK05827.1 hypothetical protein SAMN05444007_11545 [Cribrihabitans marinus]
MTYEDLERAAGASGLLVMGALHPRRCGAAQLTDGTLILLGAGPAFWPAFTTAPEARDGAPDPIDRWSRRVVGGLAAQYGAEAHFPFGGPPYAPFIDWALKSGRAFLSPTGMMVHDTVGLMISFRGALHFGQEFDLPPLHARSPCTGCPAPCLTACPVEALRRDAPYDLAACHSFLDSPAGADCMMKGCAARRACPLSAGAGRTDAQSALHMKAFHPS